MTPIVALHGFTLSGAMFAEMAAALDREVIAPDLPGHGAASTAEASMENAVSIVAAAADHAAALGYSMGGRVALRWALDHPHQVKALILVSTSPGIADAAARTARAASDEAMAVRLERDGLEAFLAWWAGRPMFAGLARRGAGWLADDLALRSANGAPGLAAALRGLGPAARPDLSGRLTELGMPVLLVAGERDSRYVAHAEQMASAIAGAQLVVVSGAGHPVVGEAPGEVAGAVARFLAEHRL